MWCFFLHESDTDNWECKLENDDVCRSRYGMRIHIELQYTHTLKIDMNSMEREIV